MVKKLFVVFLIAILFCFTGCSNSSEVNENSNAFTDAVKAITSDEITLNDLATFEWDTMYNFTPFTPKERIEEVIGFSSNEIKQVFNEGHTQQIFVKDNEVVCSIWGYGSNLGYFISFRRYEGEYLAIKSDELALFTVDNSGEELLLTYINE